MCPLRPLQEYLSVTPPGQEGKILSRPCATELFRWLFPCPLPPGCLPAFSPGEGPSPQGSRTAKPTNLSDSRLEAALAERTHRTQPLSFSQQMALGKYSSCGFCCALIYLSCSLSVSVSVCMCLSISRPRLPLLHSSHDPFLPQTMPPPFVPSSMRLLLSL